jgi:hypothetical protein
MNYDLDPEQRTNLLESATLEGEQQIGGLTLRPMTAATYSMHQRMKTLAGESDWSFNLFSFVWLHAQPLDRLRANVANPGAFLPEVFDFMNAHQPAAAVSFREWMERQLEQFAASITAANSLVGESPKA